jgi:hypothetical protein
MHVKPFTVLTEAVRRTPFRSTNGSTFDLGYLHGPPRHASTGRSRHGR